MRYDWRGNSVVVVHNFASQPRAVRLRVGVDRGDRLVGLLGEEESRAGKTGVHRLALDAYGYKWYRVGGFNYALRRARQ
jgi:maltose alpha-D-glucosyltransferase/alpha-amylase